MDGTRSTRRLSQALAAVTAVLVAFATPVLAAGSPNQHGASSGTGPRISAVAKTIKAVVVKSWGACSSGSLIWDELNANWSSYGSLAISIDYSDPDLCGDSFSLAALQASHADVVILDDPAGGNLQYTPDEIAALQEYAHQGHDLIGTYLTFAYPAGGIDNTALAPLFGLGATDGWTGGDVQITPTYKIKKAKAGNLARNLPNPYASTGFDYSQRPGDGVWSLNELHGAKIVGLTKDKQAAITIFRAKTYRAIFIANMAEYGGGTDDRQFFYNAIIYPKKG